MTATTLSETLFGHSGASISSRKYEIRPWGFASKDLEAKFIEHFFLTFAWNYKRLIFVSMSTLAAIHAYTAVSDMYNDFSNPMNLANVVKLCTSCALSYMFSRPRLTSFARAFFWAIVGAWRYLSPTVLVVQACLPGADKLKYFILTVCSALIFPLVWPRWLGTTVRVILMGWVPFTWNLYQNDSDGRKVRMVEFGLGYFVVSILGPAYGAWIAVHRRKAWLAQLKEAKQSSSKPSAKVDDAKQTAEEKTARNEVRAIRARRRYAFMNVD